MMTIANGALGLLLCGSLFAAGCGKNETAAPARTRQQLSVNAVIGWKEPYSHFLGRNISEVIGALGIPKTEKTAKEYSYLEFEDKTTSRIAGFSYLTARPVVKSIYLYPVGHETLDVNLVLAEGRMFRYDSGKYLDSTDEYFSAKDSDGNTLQFTINQSSVTFRRLIVGKEK